MLAHFRNSGQEQHPGRQRCRPGSRSSARRLCFGERGSGLVRDRSTSGRHHLVGRQREVQSHGSRLVFKIFVLQLALTLTSLSNAAIVDFFGLKF